jgi:hypothetical protein
MQGSIEEYSYYTSSLGINAASLTAAAAWGEFTATADMSKYGILQSSAQAPKYPDHLKWIMMAWMIVLLGSGLV